MGLIISALTGKKKIEDVYVDLENAKPTEAEAELFNAVSAFLAEGEATYAELDAYRGPADEIRRAMNSSTKENELAAFEKLLPTARLLTRAYFLAEEAKKVMPRLLLGLAQSFESGERRASSLQGQEALAKQLAHLFDFTLKFDQMRMSRPTLSNDFAYYRRLLGKHRDHPEASKNEDLDSSVALFSGRHIPLMDAAVNGTMSSMKLDEGAHEKHVLTVLACMANSCLEMLRAKSFESPHVNLLCARALAGCIVLYDRLTPMGVFVSSSQIHTKKAVVQLKKDFPAEPALLNSIRYLTVHFQDDSTPSGIKDLFD